MSAREAGVGMIVVGVAAALLAALANPLGIGDPGFHWRQGLLLGVGIVLVIAGAVIAWRASSSGTQPRSGTSQVSDSDR